MKSFRLIGLMSGTSLDGLDIADVTFYLADDDSWSFELHAAETVIYSEGMRSKLYKAPSLSAEDISMLSVELSQYYGDKINEFISTNNINRSQIFSVASHGQTIFHQPEQLMTLQIGNTPHIAIKSGIRSIVDFRTKDVALGGSGAPLIPIVDHELFRGEAEGFLNLGGFSNLSFKKEGVVRSYDVGPANIVINHLVKSRGLLMDKDGDIARKGELDEELFENLQSLDYYLKEAPKSLGWEWVEEKVLPLFKDDLKLEDQLYTYVVHVADQLSKAFNKSQVKSVMITGGGVHNTFLIEEIRNKFSGELIIPSKEVVDFKEAIGFAFLGLLKCLGKVNVLSSVTGAKKDSCSGVIYEP